MDNIIKFPGNNPSERLRIALNAVNNNDKGRNDLLLEEIERLHSVIDSTAAALGMLAIAILSDGENIIARCKQSATASGLSFALIKHYVASSLFLNEVYDER